MSFEMRKIIERQRNEWELKKTRTYVPRLAFDKAKTTLSNNLIKVIMGPRRAGKSVFASMLLKDKTSAYFNFDEFSIFTEFDTEELIPLLKDVYGDFEFIFFDEIQNLPGWQLLLNRLQREEYNVIVSGSNANLLSGELATHLTGRFDKIEIYPFCFSEYILAKRLIGDPTNTNMLAKEYLKIGGYPEVVIGQGIDRSNYLNNLVQAIVSKDIVTRYRLRKIGELNNTIDWIFSNVAQELSFNRLSSTSSDAGLLKSPLTAKKYISYLEEAYLVKLLGRFDLNHRERIRSPKKVFAIDNGAALTLGFRATPDDGRLLENLVYTELLKSGQHDDIKYFRSPQGNHEVDFVARRGTQTTQLIQVVWDISDQQTVKRELNGLKAAIKQTRYTNAILITWGQEAEFTIDNITVHAVPFHKWATSNL